MKVGLPSAGIEDIDEAAFHQIRSLKEYIEVVLQEKEKERRAQQLRELFGTFIIEEFYFQLVLEIEFLFPVWKPVTHGMN